jgi:isopentenyl phosphate kinase
MGIDDFVFVKLGGSLITDKTRRETPRLDVLERLAGEIVEAKAQRPGLRLLVGHGSGSFGHFAGKEYGTRGGIVAGQEARGCYGYAVTAASAARLNRLVIDALVAAGLPAVPFQPSATATCYAGSLQEMAWRPIRRALKQGLLPVVYGDVALDEAQGCTILSTEQIFAYLAGYLEPARILLVGRADGVFSQDPLRFPEAQRIPLLHADDLADVDAGLGGSHGVDVTGGMAAKVHEMVALIREMPGLSIHILSGEVVGAVSRALLDPPADIGTHIVK